MSSIGRFWRSDGAPVCAVAEALWISRQKYDNIAPPLLPCETNGITKPFFLPEDFRTI
jgi:hypothetical protein